MAPKDRLDPRTACAKQSIWNDIPEDEFRSHLIMLQERTNSVPIRPALFPLAAYDKSLTTHPHRLSIQDEQSLADDLAYIASTGEGGQSVAAVGIEQHQSTKGLVFCFAAADAIEDRTKVGLEEVGRILMSSTTAMINIQSADVERLLSTITALHEQKILGRLRSRKWQKPAYLARTHKKSLWQDFDNLLHRVQHVYIKKNHPVGIAVANELQQVQSCLEEFEAVPPDDSISVLHVVKTAYQFCRSEVMRNYARKLDAIDSPTQQVLAALKTLQQIEKIGAYEGIAVDLLKKVTRYPDLFRNINIEYLQPYASIPTSIGFERWAKTMHVHAEVQLVAHYDLVSSQQIQAGILLPRTIGTSKHLCYLCFLFIKHHGRFQPANTHGRLYDQWTVPDLLEFDEERRQLYMKVIESMDDEILNLTSQLEPKVSKRDVWRVEPMTSRQYLLLQPQGQVDIDLATSMQDFARQPS